MGNKISQPEHVPRQGDGADVSRLSQKCPRVLLHICVISTFIEHNSSGSCIRLCYSSNPVPTKSLSNMLTIEQTVLRITLSQLGNGTMPSASTPLNTLFPTTDVPKSVNLMTSSLRRKIH